MIRLRRAIRLVAVVTLWPILMGPLPAAVAQQLIVNNTLTTGVIINQTVAGTWGNGVPAILNGVAVTDTSAETCNSCNYSPWMGSHAPWAVTYNFGGPLFTGPVQANQFICNFNQGPTNSNYFSPVGRNYVCEQSVMIASNGDNGSSVTPLGAIFGRGTAVEAKSGATYLLDVKAEEFNWSCDAGSSTNICGGIALVPTASNAVHGTVVDTYIDVGNQSTASFAPNNFIYFNHAHGGQPLYGCVICTDTNADNVATGIDLHYWTFTGNFLNFAKGSWSGAGLLTTQSIAVTGTTLPTQAVGTLGIGGLSGGPTLGANGEGDILLATTLGLVLTGKGSNNDVTILNDALAPVIAIPTGTTTAVFSGQIQAASLSGGSPAKYLCLDASNYIVASSSPC